ncbi:MAG TPA: hypothetical protein VIM59_14660 [Cellvibrio sp.]
MSEHQVWLIDYKQTLQPLSKNNDDGSSFLVATAVTQGASLLDAIKNLEEYLASEGERLVDYWSCERYLPESKKIIDVVKTIHINGNDVYSDADREKAISIVIGASAGDKVVCINAMSSTFLSDIDEDQWND